MAWVDQHALPKRLRTEIFDAFECDWTVEVPSNTQPLIVLSKGDVRIEFDIDEKYPFVPPMVRIQGSASCSILPSQAWNPTQKLHTYAKIVAQHLSFCKTLREQVDHLPQS